MDTRTGREGAPGSSAPFSACEPPAQSGALTALPWARDGHCSEMTGGSERVPASPSAS